MTETNDLAYLLETLLEGNSDTLLPFLNSGGDANTIDPKWNCTLIFHAVFGGSIQNVEMLVNAGANINQAAKDPASDILAATPTALAVQCRLMMDHHKYDPIVKLLEDNGGIEQAQL